MVLITVYLYLTFTENNGHSWIDFDLVKNDVRTLWANGD